MKEENYLEGIYGCLERIEKKVEILSSAPVDKNNAVTGGETGIAMLREIRDGLERDLNGIRKSFSQYAGTLLAVSKSIQDVSGRNPLPDRTAEILAGIRKTGEQTSEEIKALLKTAGDNAKIRNEHRHTVSIESKCETVLHQKLHRNVWQLWQLLCLFCRHIWRVDLQSTHRHDNVSWNRGCQSKGH